MINLTQLSNLTTSVNAISNLILVTPNDNLGFQPQSTTSVREQTILFHYEGEQTVTLESDITDHFIEDNTSIQDQISLRPIVITTHGFIGELKNFVNEGESGFSALNFLRLAADRAQTVGAYTPELTESAVVAYNQAYSLYQTTNNTAKAALSAVNSLSSIFSSNNESTSGVEFYQTEQSRYFTRFMGYWTNRVLFTVQTPWARFPNCAIKSLRAIQSEDNKVISDFEVQFKVMNFAKTVISSNKENNAQGRVKNQLSAMINHGIGSSSDAGSLLTKLVG